MVMTERPGHLTSEIRSIAEYWDLIASPVYRGLRVPKGKGRHVLLLPGLFGNDAYIEPMHFWLRRMGYRPHRSRLLLNAGCSDRLLGQLVTRADGLGEGQDKIAIIGHSRGGMLGRALAAHLGDRCSNFIAVGSPVGGMLRMGMNGIQAMASSNSTDIAHAHVFRAGRFVQQLFDPDCDAPACGCSYFQDLFTELHPSTHVWSIYSTDDRVVDPAACPIDGAKNINVTGTHSGLMVNKSVYAQLAHALHET